MDLVIGLLCLALAALVICSPSILAWAARDRTWDDQPYWVTFNYRVPGAPLPPEQPAPRMHGYTPAPAPERVTVVREHIANGRRVRAHVRKVKGKQ